MDPTDQSRASAEPGRTLVFYNAGSGRLKRDPRALERVRALGSLCVLREVRDPQAVRDALASVAPQPSDTLCIVGGDGTMHMILTEMNARDPDGSWPRMILLPGGSTNLAALDLGMRGSLLGWIERVERFAGGARGGARSVPRAMLRIDAGLDSEPCGMFLGAGLVATATVYFRDEVRGKGPATEGASFLSTGRTLWHFLRHGAETPGVQRLRARLDGGKPKEHAAALCVITSLDRLLFGVRLRWTTEPAPLRWTVIEADARRLWLRLWRVVACRPGAALTERDGYFHRGVAEVEIEMDGALVLDGEPYEVTEHAPVRVRGDRIIEWVVPG